MIIRKHADDGTDETDESLMGYADAGGAGGWRIRRPAPYLTRKQIDEGDAATPSSAAYIPEQQEGNGMQSKEFYGRNSASKLADRRTR